jgi:hypothetical protein
MIQSNQPSNPIQSFLTTYSQQTIPKIFTHEPLPHTSDEETSDSDAATLVTSEESFTENDSSAPYPMPPLLMADPPTDPQSSRTQHEPLPTSTTRVSVDEPVSSDDEVPLNPRYNQPISILQALVVSLLSMTYHESNGETESLNFIHGSLAICSRMAQPSEMPYNSFLPSSLVPYGIGSMP